MSNDEPVQVLKATHYNGDDTDSRVEAFNEGIEYCKRMGANIEIVEAVPQTLLADWPTHGEMDDIDPETGGWRTTLISPEGTKVRQVWQEGDIRHTRITVKDSSGNISITEALEKFVEEDEDGN